MELSFHKCIFKLKKNISLSENLKKTVSKPQNHVDVDWKKKKTMLIAKYKKIHTTTFPIIY